MCVVNPLTLLIAVVAFVVAAVWLAVVAVYALAALLWTLTVWLAGRLFPAS